MTLDEHSLHLGGLLTNFQSLEFILRAFLQEHSLPTPISTGTHGTDFYSFPIGTELPENEITNYNSLGQLIDKFNASMKLKGLTEIDCSLVEIRDALAHGRASASNDDQMRLIKFSRPQSGKVKVMFNEAMTDVWFRTNKKRVLDAIQIVRKIL